MKQRAITGFLFVIVLLASLFLGQWTFIFFFIIIAFLSLQEFYKIIETKDLKINRFLGGTLGLGTMGLVISAELGYLEYKFILLMLPVFTLILLHQLYNTQSKPFETLAFTFFGILYTILPFLLFILLGFLESSYNYVFPLGFLVLLWCSDTGAYLAGRTFGRTKLFERHSPKKTWEGFAGGVALSLLAAFTFSLFYNGLTLLQWLGTAALISSFGTLGDLCESMLKRSYGIKDSGNLLPGHGGLLDRFDGLLLAAPLVYLFLALTL